MSFLLLRSWLTSFFFFNDTATTEIYTLSLHDALPISLLPTVCVDRPLSVFTSELNVTLESLLFLISSSSASSSSRDRKSTRLNSSHGYISYAVFCLKKKNKPSPIYTSALTY